MTPISPMLLLVASKFSELAVYLPFIVFMLIIAKTRGLTAAPSHRGETALRATEPRIGTTKAGNDATMPAVEGP